MPKQIFQVKDFSGGLNTLQSGVDINDNQVRQAKNVMFNIRGIIQSAYNMANTTEVGPNGDGNLLTRSTYSNSNVSSTTSGESVQPGYGLGYFETDYQTVVGNTRVIAGDHTGLTREGLWYVSSGDNHYILWFSAITTDGNLAQYFPVGSSISITGLSGGTGGLATADKEGIFTVVSHKSTSGSYFTFNAVQLNRPLLSGNETYFAATIKGYPSGDQIILLANPIEHKIDVFSTKNDTTWASDVITLCDFTQGFTSKVKYYKVEDSIRCCDTTENSQSKIKWYGFIARTHFSGTTNQNIILGFYSKDNDLAAPTAGTLVDGATTPAVISSYASAGTGFDINVSTDTAVNGTIPSGTYEFAETFIYDGNQESLPRQYASAASITVDAADDLKVLSVNVGAQGDYDERISGGRIYIREKNTNGEWILLIDMDLQNGCRVNLIDEYTAWDLRSSDQFNCPDQTAGNNFIISELNLTTYEVINGFPSSVFSIDIGANSEKWKDSVVANNRAFVCGVNIADKNKGLNKSNSTPTFFRDRIMYSMPHRFDTFPYHNYIEAAKGDADHYTAIESYADRLLAFKRFSLDIINIAADDRNWFLEDSLKYQGVMHPEAVKRTQHGAIWANKQGLFLYNGTQIKNLSENLIADQTWAGHITDDTGIIYDEQESMVFVIKDMGVYGDAYMCDLKTNTFTFLKDFIPDTNDGITNSVDTEANNTLIAHDEGDTIDFYQFYRSQATIPQIEFKTKYYDFGNPDVMKRIYAVYITYRCTDHALTNQFTLAQPDGTSTALAGTMATATNFTTVKIAPSSPISCGRVSLVLDTSTSDPTLAISDVGFEYRIIKKKVS